MSLLLLPAIFASQGGGLAVPPPPPPALTLEAWGTPVTQYGGTSFSVPLVDDWAEGERLITVLEWSDKRTVTGVPSGWDEIASHVHSGSGGGSIKVYAKTAGSSESSPTWTFNNNAAYIGAMHRISGFDTSNPQDATATTTQGTSASASSPAITTVTNGALLLHFAGATWGGWIGSDTGYPDDTTGMYVRRTGSGGGEHQSLGGAYRMAGDAGTKGAVTWGIPGSSLHWVGVTVAIRPAT